MTTPDNIQRALEILKRGGLVAIPTETVYGLAADASNELAVRHIFATKGRPATHPLIVHLPTAEHLSEWAREIPAIAHDLVQAFWPGPLSLVLKRTTKARDVITGGQDTVALRVPSHPVTQELLRRLDFAVAAPSANRFGAVSPTTAEHVRADLGADVEFILDGGPSTVGVESTIVDLTTADPRILRPGGISKEALIQVLGREISVVQTAEVRTPGALPSHYAPRAGLMIARKDNLAEVLEHAKKLGFKSIAVLGASAGLPDGVTAVEIADDATGFARQLYARLREIDTAGHDLIIAVPPDTTGLGLAVLDRLSRAAAPRPAS